MGEFNELNHIHLDILKEIGNIGAGNAATSLSNLLDKKVEMSVPVVNIVSFDEMMEQAGGSEDVQAAVFVQMMGATSGSMFFVLDPEDADQFVSLLIGEPGSSILDEGDNEIAVSAFVELGNILTGSYLRALSDFTQLNVYQSVPTVSIDMVGAMLSQGLLQTSMVSDQVIMIETLLHDVEGTKSDIRGHFFLLPDPDAFTTIFKALGVNDHE
ncbi:CheY-P-specific phosphatase CheC [Halalkalibacillus sediminis]|uniref:CheY-P-specific phosphatase CheC n=1 Tax=Halalkalibacillus sediminis TaxID=2018042 RepID=A0A2I0QWC7_9BACI|nr:chemotaxis protein CheC [Halalkalibacillus sediminis]PKR78642.1 CheY-P-specific phosphatase CheC [Halalkalibacillus sediminis]